MSLNRAILQIVISLLLSTFILGGGSLVLFTLYDATQIGLGIGFSVFNVLVYGLVCWGFFIKKNVAWTVPLIVIKYAILIVAIYYVWAYCKPALVVSGMVSSLILTALVWLVVDKATHKRMKNGPL